MSAIANINTNNVDNVNQWMFVLTDGDDNHSRDQYQPLLDEIKTSGSKLIIATAGRVAQDTVNSLIRLTHASPNGKFINRTSNSTEVLRDIFREAREIMTTGMETGNAL